MLRRINIFPKRVHYFFSLKRWYILDNYFGCKVKKQIESKSSLPVGKWKNNLETVQPILNLLRLELDADEVIKRSEDVLSHRFSLLGSTFNKQTPGRKSSEYISIPWHTDPDSGYGWAKSGWYRNSRKEIPIGTDIKKPWELSRCQHFILLGEAYQLTENEQYTREYCNQVIDWIRNNPVRYGPNWAVTMEVGIRIANWLVVLLYFVKSPELNVTFLSTLLKSAREHGQHIMSNLENISLTTSNHYMGNITGLYFLSVLTQGLQESKKWKAYARKELEREIFRQTFEDGWHFESSTAYHRLVTEMFLYAFLLSEYVDEPFSENYLQRLIKMIEVLGEVIKPNGMIPQIGDNDSGRFLVFNVDRDLDELSIKYLLETANRSSKIYPNINGNDSIFFKTAGRYLFRSNCIYLMIVAGPKGTAGLGAHAHNDVLSFELNVEGKDLLVDPGTACYTSDPIKRNRFRSISHHNSLHWEGLEPCSLNNGLFELFEDGNLRVETCVSVVKDDHFSAIYEYKDHFHRREIRFKKLEEEIEVIDTCSHVGATLSFNCAPNIKPILLNNGFKLKKTVFSFDNVESITVKPSQYSPAYGKIELNNVVKVALSTKSIAWRIKTIRSNNER